ncbi:MAG: hypothetical protein LBJ00_01355 [Planctomycetaceae bacterium]|jgi:hypothetical protein|nr:hypothetical protein [Planctomycetaceae bacterium]
MKTSYDLTGKPTTQLNRFFFYDVTDEKLFAKTLDELIAADFFSMIAKSKHKEIKKFIMEKKNLFVEETNRLFYIHQNDIWDKDWRLEIQNALKLPAFHAFNDAVVKAKWLCDSNDNDSYKNTIYYIMVNDDRYKLWTLGEFCQFDWIFKFQRVGELLEIILAENAKPKNKVILAVLDAEPLPVAILSEQQIDILIKAGFLQTHAEFRRIHDELYRQKYGSK